MTTPHEPDAILTAWLEEGPSDLPETTRRAIAVGLRSTRQTRRVLDVPWRPNAMNTFARLAVAAAAIVIFAGGALYLISPGNQNVGGPDAMASAPASVAPRSVAPSAEPSASASASVPVITEWQTVTSDRFGYSVDIPADWVESSPTSDLPPDLFPGDGTQYANRWDRPVTRSPSIYIATRDPEPEESLVRWTERSDTGFAADCDGTGPAQLTVGG